MARLPAFPTDCLVTVDGHAIAARSGESVASALLAAGRPLLARSAKYHRPRGAFCLAGTCGSCLVRAGGLPNQRACRTPCTGGLVVETQNAFPDARHDLLGAIDRAYPSGLDHHHFMTWNALANRAAVAVSRRLAGLGTLPDPGAARAPLEPVAEERLEALVIGGGPAGLAAALALADGGRRVLLAEAEPRAGGRLRARLGLPGDPDPGFTAAALARIATAGEVALGAAVLGLWQDGGAPLAAIALAGTPPRLRLVRPERVILCTGGAPLPPSLVDGDRPGVFGARGLLVALAEHGVVPGRRALVLGAGEEAGAVAARLGAAGVEVAVLEQARGRVRGRARVRALELEGAGAIRCDAIAVATPPAPLTDLARSAGAAVVFDPAAGAFAVRADAAGRTGVPWLLAAGEVTGPMDAGRAAEMGRRAGEAARG